MSTLDLSDVFGRVAKLPDSDRRVKEKIDEITGYASAAQVPGSALMRMAKLGVVLLDWMDQNDLHASAIQCWSSMQQNFGVNVCTVMSIMSERLMPSACEVDIAGVVAMYALQLASGKPSALVDWNNNYGGDRNKCVFFHCGNWAKSFLPDVQIGTAPILGTTLGEENTYGAVAGRTPSGPVTFAPRQHRRRKWMHSDIRWRRAVHGRSACHLREPRRSSSRASEAYGAHLQEWLRAPCGDEWIELRVSARRRDGGLPRLARV